MWAFLVEQPNLPYTIAFACVLALGVFEAFALVIGLSMMSALDQWVPIDADYDADVSPGGLTGIAGWLCLNRLPLLIWFVLALTSFAIAGYIVNFISVSVAGFLLPQLFTLPIAIVASAFSCRYFGRVLADHLPKNESSAISLDDLSGYVGTITLGCAIKGMPSEAVVRDKHQQKHYVLVEPETSDIEFASGTQVVLLKREGRVWSATRFDN
ncbi:YqiJ family protein [Shewanella sp. SM101]|uniref:YqiJ family protein n=1 Tax=Shewanella sp. SM101 TaxID=2912789 RepID=UPI0021DA0AE2|nr:YqiJ family protein [Shewanella sp. SM101]MCU8103263.1 YqiJ family protein [Shewanella sp. SM101]